MLTGIWEWFDEKKTNIGAACLLAALAIDKVFIGIWSYDDPNLIKVMDTFTWVGGAFSTGGLLHKLIKKKAKPFK